MLLPTYSYFRLRSSITAEIKSPTSCSSLLFSLYWFMQMELSVPSSILWRITFSVRQRPKKAQGWWCPDLTVTYCGPRQPWHASFPSLSWHANNTSLASSSCRTRGAIRALKPTKDKTTLLSSQLQQGGVTRR